ncbi:MAG TPA: Hsp20/alpha crystallin family protein [Burkholderiales bacterium]|jgi:HSP20 family protein|nr:Hsp20/alpha crystallin family protein [Burkholderiales bacterium]
MIHSLTELSRGVSRAWDSVAQGWRELIGRSGQALTKFNRARDASSPVPVNAARAGGFPTWSLLAGEVIDKGKALVVQLEVPGVEKDDLEILVRDHALHVRGERRVNRDYIGDWYYRMERAYGSFQRVVPLPVRVEASKAHAELRNGVLTITVPKAGNGKVARLPIK